MDRNIAGLIAIAVALLCCALPLLVAAGILGGLAVWLRSGPVIAVVIVAVAIAIAIVAWRHHTRGRGRSEGAGHDRPAGRRKEIAERASDRSSRQR